MPYTQLLTASNINDYDSFVVVVFTVSITVSIISTIYFNNFYISSFFSFFSFFLIILICVLEEKKRHQY